MIRRMDRRGMLGVAAWRLPRCFSKPRCTPAGVAQFYHFAFLVVSLALLGFGASGTILVLTPRLGTVPINRLLGEWDWLRRQCSDGLRGCELPSFDSYSIAWDRRQILFLLLYYLALALPFLCAGIGIGAGLAVTRGRSHLVYAANLLGSAAGVLVAPLVLWLAGVPGAVVTSALIGLSPAVLDQHARRTRLSAGLLLLLGLAGSVPCLCSI
jgi:hypothetical protein